MVYLNYYVILNFALFSLMQVVSAESTCQSTSCPVEAPYCTPAGCVQECPDNSLVNETHCVLDCASGVVDGNKCIDKCPEGKNITVIKVMVLGNTFKRIRFCYESCEAFDVRSFEYEYTCVSECPAEFSFVANNKCMAQCPSEQSLHMEKWASTNKTYVECVHVCPNQKPIVNNNTCVTECGNDDVVFERSCVRTCPNESYFVFNSECVTDCPNGTYRTDTSCTSECLISDPDNLRYVYKQSCVEACPNEYKYMRRYKAVNESGTYYLKECVANCEDDYYFGRDCVPYCPTNFVLANMSCVQKCPNSAPFVWFSFKFGMHECVTNCPAYMFHDKNKCENFCHKNMYSIMNKKFCVQNCPETFPILYRKSCMKECPNNTYSHHLTCSLLCPHLTHHRNCVTQCPIGTQQIEDKCIDSCPDGTYWVGSSTNGGSCLSPWVFYGNIIGAIVFFFVFLIAGIKLFHLRLPSCSVGILTYPFKIFRSMRPLRFQRMVEEDVASETEGNDLAESSV